MKICVSTQNRFLLKKKNSGYEDFFSSSYKFVTFGLFPDGFSINKIFSFIYVGIHLIASQGITEKS
jgi:hypothetical protein